MDPVNAKVVFTCDKDIVLADQKASECFETAVKATEVYARELKEAAQFLFQRQSQIGSIEKEHLAKKKALDDSFIQVSQLWKAAQMRIQEIAFLDDPKRSQIAFKALIQLEIRTTILDKQRQNLGYILGSGHHHRALECYKTKKRFCQELEANEKMSVSEKIMGLRRTFQETKKVIEEETGTLHSQTVIAHQTALLYEELLQFIAYTANSFITPADDAAAQLARLSVSQNRGGLISWVWSNTPSTPANPEDTARQVGTLKQEIENLEKSLAPYLPKRKERKAVEESVARYIAEWQGEKLEAKDNFRNNQLLADYIYKEIRTEVDSLRSISKALVQLQKEIQARTEALCGLQQKGNRDVKELEVLLDGLEEAIYEQRDHLEKLRYSKRVHAGRYFVAKLISKVVELREDLHQCKSLSTRSFRPYAKGCMQLIEFLEPAQTLEKLTRATNAACLLQKTLNARPIQNTLYEVARDILARFGAKTLTLTLEERQVAGQLLLQTPLAEFRSPDEDPGNCLPDRIVSCLMKGFIRCRNFQSQDYNPELDMIIYKLKYDELYQDAFLTTLRFNQSLHELYTHYVQTTRFDTNHELFGKMVSLLVILRRNPGCCFLERVFSYCEAKFRLAEVSQAQMLLERFLWLKHELDPLFANDDNLLPSFYKEYDTISIEKLESEKELSTITSKVRLELELQGMVVEKALPDALEVKMRKVRAKVFYRLLVSSIFAKDQESTLQLVQRLDALERDQLPNDREGLDLLRKWVVDQFMSDAPVQTKHGEFILTGLVKEYLDPASKTHTQWQAAFGTTNMELLIHKLFTLQGDTIGGIYGAQLAHRSDQGLLKFWNQVLTKYKEFLVLLAKEGSFDRSKKPRAYEEAQALVDGARECFLRHNPNNHRTHYSWLGLAADLYFDLCQKFQFNDVTIK